MKTGPAIFVVFFNRKSTQIFIKESKCDTTPTIPKSSNSLRKQQCNLLWLLFSNNKAKTWNVYSLAYSWVVIVVTLSGRFENLFLNVNVFAKDYKNN